MPGVWDIIYLSGEPLRLTNYNFHTHVQYGITIDSLLINQLSNHLHGLDSASKGTHIWIVYGI